MNKELIARFFKKQCTPAEARQVAAYLKANPALIEKYVSVHEWNSTEPNEFMPEEFWSEIWNNIQKENKTKIISLKLKRIVAAACLILMIGATYYYLFPKKKINQPITVVTVLPKTQQQTVSNTTKKIVQVVLEDSSVVKLSPGSSIQYDVPFQNNKRNILLEGEAKFIVAKNKNKPFTVFTGVLATTALGTIFSIKTSRDKNNITVKLFRGKVVIHTTDTHVKGWSNDVYLSPGQQMKFNAASRLVAVEKINNVANDLVKTRKPAADSLNRELNFTNALLPDVINKLSAFYNVKINYDPSLIDTINFTGTVSKNDSLPVILKAISQMNDLDIIKSDNEFIISKHQQ